MEELLALILLDMTYMGKMYQLLIKWKVTESKVKL